ncbi:MAG: tetratricopeptide repeat protein [Sandaracinaceae bacterium]|nr:tetratricopeptide repeat protein [Sandaracinaceae bacterium]
MATEETFDESASNDPTFAEASATARANPSDDAAWDALEDWAGATQRPDDVSVVYREVLKTVSSAALGGPLAQRALNFHEEWFGEDAPQIIEVLERAMDVDPHASDWAFQRLTVIYTGAERWDELFTLYDRAIASSDDDRKAGLLEEAAQTAKDFAGRSDRAVDYLRQLRVLRPDDAGVAANLERLLERAERWSDLIEFWRASLGTRTGAEAHAQRMRIAGTFLDKLGDDAGALREVKAALVEAPADAEAAVAMLERIVANEEGDADVRREALQSLKEHYTREGRATDVVRTLDTALALAADDERAALHKEAGQRLEAQGRNDEALAHYADAVLLAPQDAAAREKLRAFGEQLGAVPRVVAVLTEVADATEDGALRTALRVESAELLRATGDASAATTLLEAVLTEPALEAATALTCARNLSALYALAGRAEEHLSALERLAGLEPDPGAQRKVWAEVARAAEAQGAPDRALRAYEAALALDPSDAHALAAIVEVLEAQGRWADLVEALRRRCAAGTGWQQRQDLVRIAGIQATHLDATADAIATWTEVSEAYGESADVVDALAELYTRTEQHAALAELLGRAADREDAHLAAVRCRLGETYFTQLGDSRAAVAAYRRALLADPSNESARQGLALLADDESVRGEAVSALARSYELADEWEPLLALLDQRLALAKGDEEVVELLTEAARLQEQRAGAKSAALASMCRVIALRPFDRRAEAEVMRLAEEAEQPLAAATALEAAAQAAEGDADRRAALLEQAAILFEEKLGDHAAALGAYTGALSAMPRSATFADAVVRLGPLAGEGAEDVVEMSLQAVCEGEPPTGHLRLLAGLQRRNPGRALYDTLLRISEREPADLAGLHEAARLADETLHDAELARTTYASLYERAAGLLRRAGAEVDDAVVTIAAAAVRRLVALYHDASATQDEIAIQLEAAKLPLEATERLAFRRAAAALAAQAGDRDTAIEQYRLVHAAAPADTEATDALSRLLTEAKRHPELLELCQEELANTQDQARRLHLRLEIARLVAAIEASGGRLEALRKNLEEVPGHEASIAMLASVYEAQGRHADLADMLAAQANQADSERARALFERAARIAEQQLHDDERALESYRRVVELSPTSDALDALARIHEGRGEYAAAARWLERRLSLASEGESASISRRLAKALFQAGRDERAAEVLEAARARAPQDAEVRDLLANHYRKTEALEPLARLLSDAALGTSDSAAALRYVREAAEIFCDRLETPGAAVAVLTRGVELDPEDKELALKLADGLRAGGQLDQARTTLEALIESYGRRRSAERAAVHHRLGLVAREQGDLPAAIEQLELATKMAMASAPILQTLGDLAREAGDLDRAEKAYRTLLMAVRRRGADEEVDVGVGEVLFELHAIAAARSDETQARELRESALEAAGSSDAEALRFGRALVARGDAALALEGLRRRTAAVDDTPENAASSAALRAALGDVLAGPLGRGEEALAEYLRALSADSTVAPLHKKTRALARELGKTSLYVTALEASVDACRREEDAEHSGELLLRLGRVIAEDLGEPQRAGETFRRAEEALADPTRAWLALARLEDGAGDLREQTRVLEALVEAESVPQVDRVDALYRLAAIELGADGDVEAGVANLRKAFSLDPRYDQAGELLADVARRDPSVASVMAFYEEVARGSGDESSVLDFLSLRSTRPDATLPQVREGVERAASANDIERMEAFLARAVEIARATEDAAAVRWALLLTSERREARGDVRGALESLKEAAESAEGDEARELRLRVATAARQEGGDLALAAEAYEELLVDEPVDPTLWEPLLEVYAQQGEIDRLNDRVSALIDALLEPKLRNRARMVKGRFLAQVEGREYDAVDVLRNVLDEEPDHSEAAALLTELYERSGYDEDLVELLHRQLDAARDNSDLEVIAAASLKLGGLLEKVERLDAMEIYRRALEWVPAERPIVEALLRLHGDSDDPRELTELRERLLATEQGAAASSMARQVYKEWQALGDEDGMRRALEGGYRGNPTDGSIRMELEHWYRERSEYEGLANYLAAEAARLEDDADTSRALLLEAASIQRDQLGNPAGAVDVLRVAYAASRSLAILRELVQSLEAAGDLEGAVREVAGALERHQEGGQQDVKLVALLRMRAALSLSRGDAAAAVDDLEAALATSQELGDDALQAEVEAALTSALTAARDAAVATDDHATRRAATLRLVELYAATDATAAREELAQWVEHDPSDREALIRLRDMDVTAERWDGVAHDCARLLGITEGSEQVEAALLLADASERAGVAQYAKEGLEYVCSVQPGIPALVERLRALYESIGAYRELADMLLVDAEGAPEEDRFELFRRAGRLLIDGLGDPRAAIPALEAAAHIRPDDHETTLFLADSYMAYDRHADAGALLEAAIGRHTRRRTPELAELQQRMAKLALAADEKVLAMQWLQAAIESDKNNGDIASELSLLSMELGDLDTALSALRAVTLAKTQGSMSRAMAFLYQARIAHDRGEARRALLWARKAKSEDPDLQAATDFLAELGES